MSAAVVTSALPIPCGASAIERGSIRVAAAVTRWATARAELRQERHERMLQQIQADQVAKPDPRAIDYALAQLGLRLR